jgi:D-alanyl-D-alanine carboxypeptidase
MIPPRQKFTIVRRTFRYFLLLCALLVLTGVTFLGVQWFSDSVQTFFTGQVSYNQSSFTSAVDVNASTQPVETLQVVPVPEVIPALQVKPVPENNQPAVKVIPNKPAEVALSVAVDNGVVNTLFSRNSQEQLPIASLTKLMTALVVLENDDLNQYVVISPAAMAQEGEQGVLKLGEAMSVRNLLYIALIESSNRAAYALSEVSGASQFIDMMNARAQSLGMLNTHFADASGLSAQSYSTAGDLAVLTQYLFDHFPLFREIVSLKEYNLYVNGVFHHKLVNTNNLLGIDNIIGGKTGFTDEAKGCFMVIQKNDATENYVIHIILGADDRFTEMQKLINIASHT